MVGFSDTTALQLGLLKKTKLVTYAGFTLTVQPNTLIEQTLMACLSGKSYRITKGVGVCPGIAKRPPSWREFNVTHNANGNVFSTRV